ncbi:MAG: ParA family protein [Candidatus Dojkabacteria bacterium]
MILAVTNQKGGVGKTTTVLNLGVYLAVKGQKTLLVDIDPQSNLTSGLGVKGDLQNKENITNQEPKTIYDVLVNKEPAESAVLKTRIKNLDIIPCTIELAGAEVELVGSLSRESILKKAIENVSKNYDFVIIDCPPSLGLLTINGLVAANNVLIPVQSEYYALEGLGQLINTVKLIKNNLNSSMDVGGVILTMYDPRTNLSKDVAGETQNFFGDKVFKSVVPRNIKLSEAPSHGLSIYEYAPNSSGAQAYEQLATEVIKRFTREGLVRPMLTKAG